MCFFTQHKSLHNSLTIVLTHYFPFYYGSIFDLLCFRCVAKWIYYMYIYIYFQFFSIKDYYKILIIVPCLSPLFKFKFFSFYFLIIYLFLAALGLHCCVGFSLQQVEISLHCSEQASYCGGFSYCGAQALGHMGFSSCVSWALEHRLSSYGTWV